MLLSFFGIHCPGPVLSLFFCPLLCSSVCFNSEVLNLTGLIVLLIVWLSSYWSFNKMPKFSENIYLQITLRKNISTCKFLIGEIKNIYIINMVVSCLLI